MKRTITDEAFEWFKKHSPCPPGVSEAYWTRYWGDAALIVTDGVSPMKWARRYANGPVYLMVRAWCAAHPDAV